MERTTHLKLVICYIAIFCTWIGSGHTFEDDFVDFTDMGNFDHASQNYIVRKDKPGNVEEVITEQRTYKERDKDDDLTTNQLVLEDRSKQKPNEFDLEEIGGGSIGKYPYHYHHNQKKVLTEFKKTVKFSSPNCPTIDESGSMRYLRRIVGSLLYQMEVKSHIFGPGEAITIDLQAEISYEDFMLLTDFSTSEAGISHLNEVDRIISSLLRAVDPPIAYGYVDYLKDVLKNDLFYTLKFWIVFGSVLIVSFMVFVIFSKMIRADSCLQLFGYGFALTFILSCVWCYSKLYEDARALKYANMMQNTAPPKDCDFNNLGILDSIGYFLRVQCFGYKDRCAQYHTTVLIDPIWSTLPVQAVSETFAVLIFTPAGFIGQNCGAFISGLIGGIPYLLRPIFFLFIVLMFFVSIFRFKISSPFLSIEPNWRLGLPSSSTQRNEIMQRPEHSVVRAGAKDKSTDTDDLEDYIRSSDNSTNTSSRQWSHRGRTWNMELIFSTIQSGGLRVFYGIKEVVIIVSSLPVWSYVKEWLCVVLHWIDLLLRGTLAVPEDGDSPRRGDENLSLRRDENLSRRRNEKVPQRRNENVPQRGDENLPGPSGDGCRLRKRKSNEHPRSQSVEECNISPKTGRVRNEPFVFSGNDANFNFSPGRKDGVWEFGRDGGGDADSNVRKTVFSVIKPTSKRKLNRRHSSGAERIAFPRMVVGSSGDF